MAPPVFWQLSAQESQLVGDPHGALTLPHHFQLLALTRLPVCMDMLSGAVNPKKAAGEAKAPR